MLSRSGHTHRDSPAGLSELSWRLINICLLLAGAAFGQQNRENLASCVAAAACELNWTLLCVVDGGGQLEKVDAHILNTSPLI